MLVNAVVNDPQPNSTIMTLETKVDLKIALTARIEPVTLALFQRDYGVDDAYAKIDIPGQKIKGNHSLGITDTLTPLLNQTAWREFVHQVVFQEEVSLALDGWTNAYLGVLKSHVHLDKNVVTPGMNYITYFTFFFIYQSSPFSLAFGCPIIIFFHKISIHSCSNLNNQG